MTDNVVHKSDTDNDNRLIKDEDEDEGVIETQNDNILGIHIVIYDGCFNVYGDDVSFLNYISSKLFFN